MRSAENAKTAFNDPSKGGAVPQGREGAPSVLFSARKNEKWTYVCEIRSCHASKWRSTSTMRMGVHTGVGAGTASQLHSCTQISAHRRKILPSSMTRQRVLIPIHAVWLHQRANDNAAPQPG